MADRRRRLLTVLAGAAVLAPFAVGWAMGAEPDDGRVVFSFADPEIAESSGLVAAGDRVWTVNDSGDIGRVFSVDAATGRTVGTTYWADGPRDVEALAPAGPGRVWVGDIGDNTGSRDSIQVTRVPVGDGDRTVDEETIDLVYPDGPRDAETLIADPTTGRLLVVTKGVFAGEVYAAPPEMADDAPNQLGLKGQVVGLVTDGAFFPDGRHVVLRTYSRAVVYTFPELETVGTWDLPAQQQGEGLAVTPDGRVLLSSEGVGAQVLSVRVPARIERAMAEPVPTTAAPTSSPDGGTTVQDVGDAPPDRYAWPWLAWGVVGVIALGVLWRSLRPH
ncbi:hypothetical protein [Nocardioides sp. Soil805]|uniref:hypothetical protein n=1 Tax=Nocardioides sp. Soil805 TaxID=1736416 RepID=UPI0007027569|nr:hypothetical protein [Nocardioides sp. Soil805]KRF37051.1 hypothetical protein ASG94_06660 [Nocardioides sp. Soil805]